MARCFPGSIERGVRVETEGVGGYCKVRFTPPPLVLCSDALNVKILAPSCKGCMVPQVVLPAASQELGASPAALVVHLEASLVPAKMVQALRRLINLDFIFYELSQKNNSTYPMYIITTLEQCMLVVFSHMM